MKKQRYVIIEEAWNDSTNKIEKEKNTGLYFSDIYTAESVSDWLRWEASTYKKPELQYLTRRYRVEDTDEESKIYIVYASGKMEGIYKTREAAQAYIDYSNKLQYSKKDSGKYHYHFKIKEAHLNTEPDLSLAEYFYYDDDNDEEGED